MEPSKIIDTLETYQVPLPKISDDCPEVEYTGILCEFKYDHGDFCLRKIAIC